MAPNWRPSGAPSPRANRSEAAGVSGSITTLVIAISRDSVMKRVSSVGGENRGGMEGADRRVGSEDSREARPLKVSHSGESARDQQVAVRFEHEAGD